MNSPRHPYQVLYHVFFWLLVFAIWYFLRFQDYALRSTALKVTAVKVADLALMVYLTNYVLLPRLLYTRRYLWFILAFIALVLTSSIVKMQILSWVMGIDGSILSAVNLKQRIYDNVIPHFFLVAAGAAIQLMLDYRKLQQRLAETAREKAEAELNFLKSQMNPHFLFNSLNTVYFLIDKKNEAARNALHQFSDMLRYQLYEMNGNAVPIEKELQFLKGYFEMQRLRKDAGYELSLQIAEHMNGFMVEPLLLVPFVENAFKHISHFPEGHNFVRIRISNEDGKLHFYVENSRGTEPLRDKGGIGLTNVKRRLQLLYPEKHKLDIVEEEKRYEVKLTIEVDQN